MKNYPSQKIRSTMGILGLLGLLGVLGFLLEEPIFCSFFAFFGFGSWFWWGKLAKEQWDERLIANQLRATNEATTVCFALIFAGMILTGNVIDSHNIKLAYTLLISLVSLGFATSSNLTAYLTWKYDREA